VDRARRLDSLEGGGEACFHQPIPALWVPVFIRLDLEHEAAPLAAALVEQRKQAGKPWADRALRDVGQREAGEWAPEQDLGARLAGHRDGFPGKPPRISAFL